MRLAELYYRAFKSFKEHSQKDSNGATHRKIIKRANESDDFLTAIKYKCKIKSDWIKNIEEGLIYIEKAIKEDRQFIRSEGEVLPIEKVKKVSKASVEHLSRHSELITRVPKDKTQDLIPEKLYMVEKLTDFQVYENRFIYMLLKYLKDFIQLRLDKIKDKSTTFESKLNMDKALTDNQRHLKYVLNHHDVHKNDPYLIDQYKRNPLVKRIETIYATVSSLLATPLMKEVSKAPLIKPPIIKTNALRMNQNFRAALKLYDYINAYHQDGYSIEEIKRSFNPFPESFSDDISETIQLTSNLAYVLGNDLEETLEKKYLRYIRNTKEAENKKLLDELKRLKKRLNQMDEDPSEYILKLEKRNLRLEKNAVELSNERDKNESLLETIQSYEEKNKTLQNENQELLESIAQKKKELETMNQKYFDDLNEAEEVHEQEVIGLNNQHQKDIESIELNHAEIINSLKKDYENTLSSIKKDHEQEKNNLNQVHQEEITLFNDRIKTLDDEIQSLNNELESSKENLQNTINDYETHVESLNQKINRLDEEKKFSKAQYVALKKQQGLLEEDDYTSKEKFKQLEAEMNAYKKLFKEQWKKTKSEIRQKVKAETFSESKDDHTEN